MSDSALMGIGRGSGEGRALEAAKIAVNSPLLETSIHGASGVIFNVTGGPDMTIHEVYEAAEVIHESVLDDAIVIFGAVVDDRIQGEVQITVIATGFDLKPQGAEKSISDSLSLFSTATASASPLKKKTTQETASTMLDLDIPEFLRDKKPFKI